MNQKLKPASRLSVVFILVVVLSGSILTWFSINNISNQKELTEKQILEEQQQLSSRFLHELQNQIDLVTSGLSNQISSTAALRDSLDKKAATFGFITHPFIIKKNGNFIYPNFAGIANNNSSPKFSNWFKSAYSAGEKAEFAESNLNLAKENYLQCLRISKGKPDSARALNALGRVSMKLNEQENAIRYYNTLVVNHFEVSDGNGVPHMYYALPQLVKLTNAGNIEKQFPVFQFCLEKMKEGAVPLNISTNEIVTQVSQSILKFLSNQPEELSQISLLESKINQQLEFVTENGVDLPKLLQNEGVNKRFSNSDGFKIIISSNGVGQECFLVNPDFSNPEGFLININNLFETVLKTNLLYDFEFEYNVEFTSGYKSNSPDENLVYFSQMTPFFPEQMIQVSLSDENLIVDFIHRKSWIYGISTVLLLVAMVLGVVLIVRDIAREKRLAQLQSDFISNVTHELKTPLTSISMFAESMLLKRVKKDSDRDEYLSIILKESERLKRMINNILEFSKLEKGKSEYHFVRANLALLVKTAIQEFDYWFEKEGFQVVTELDNKIEANIDPEKMKQVFENLLNNAIKYSQKNKKIITRLYLNANYIHIEIEDRGIGISENEQSHIFEKFYRINHNESISGTGLGLTVVKEIVEAHGGQIIVTSEPGKGSKFSIILNQQTEIG